MKLNHLNLTVFDVPAAVAFLETYFGLKAMGGNAGITVMTDAEEGWGFVLSLMKAKRDFAGYPESFHLGFFVGSRDEVDSTHARLKADGYGPSEPEDQGHAYGFYVSAPGGFLVEMGA